MDMNKTNSSIDENEESLVGEVLSDDEVREKKQAIAKWLPCRLWLLHYQK